MSFLQQRILFNLGLSDHAARAIGPLCRIVSIETKSNITECGCDVDYWDIVINGIVVANQMTVTGKHQMVYFYSEGSWFGDIEILSRSKTNVKYVSMSSVDLMRVPADVFLDLIERESSFLRILFHQNAKRSSLIWQSSIILKTGNPWLKTLYGMAICAESSTSSFLINRRDVSNDSHHIPLRQELLAQYCGMSRSVLSRQLQILARFKLISIDYSDVSLVSVGQWRKLMRYIINNHNRAALLTPDELINSFIKDDCLGT